MFKKILGISVIIILFSILMYIAFSYLPILLILYLLFNFTGIILTTPERFHRIVVDNINTSISNKKPTTQMVMIGMGYWRVLIAFSYTVVFTLLLLNFPYNPEMVLFLSIPTFYFNIGIVIAVSAIITANVINSYYSTVYKEIIISTYKQINKLNGV